MPHSCIRLNTTIIWCVIRRVQCPPTGHSLSLQILMCAHPHMPLQILEVKARPLTAEFKVMRAGLSGMRCLIVCNYAIHQLIDLRARSASKATASAAHPSFLAKLLGMQGSAAGDASTFLLWWVSIRLSPWSRTKQAVLHEFAHVWAIFCPQLWP